MNKDSLIDKINSLSNRFIPLLKEILPLLDQPTKSDPTDENMADAILRVLHSFGLEGRRLEKSGVMVELPGGVAPSTTKLLFQLDPFSANEIQNTSSNNHEAGRRLARGYESYFAIGLGVLWVLNKIMKEVSGSIRVFFQTRPEITLEGDENRTQDEVLEQVKAMYGIRLDSSIPAECVGIHFGAVMASTDTFSLTIRSNPNQTFRSPLFGDIIQVAAHVVTALKQLTSRKLNPLKPAIISLKSIHTVDDDSDLPVAVKLNGIVNTMDEDAQKQIPSLIEDTVQGITDAYGCEYLLEIDKVSTVLRNDKDLTTNLKQAAEEILGNDKVVVIEYPRVTTESFAKLYKDVPYCILHLGTANIGKTHQDYHPRSSLLSDRCIGVGVKTLSWSLLKFLEKNSRAVQS
jgi:amidohydrolase